MAAAKKHRYVVVRSKSASPFFGILESRKGTEVVLRNARRLWYWDGAATLSELANRGVSKPNKCKFPAPVSRVVLLEAIEVIDATDGSTQKHRRSTDMVSLNGDGSGSGFGSGYGYGDC